MKFAKRKEVDIRQTALLDKSKKEKSNKKIMLLVECCLILYILVRIVLVKLIGVKKGRCVTLKYFCILIKFSRKHRLFIGP